MVTDVLSDRDPFADTCNMILKICVSNNGLMPVHKFQGEYAAAELEFG